MLDALHQYKTARRCLTKISPMMFAVSGKINLMNDSELERAFQISAGEFIFWSGQPDKDVNFKGFDWFLIPFFLAWGGGVAIFGAMLIWGVFINDWGFIKYFVPLFGLALISVGLYVIFGRFLYKRWKKVRTFYAVTNQRILILTRMRKDILKEIHLNSINKLDLFLSSNGNGSIYFNRPEYFWLSSDDLFSNTGLDFLKIGTEHLAFYDIKDANQVYKIIQNARSSFDNEWEPIINNLVSKGKL